MEPPEPLTSVWSQNDYEKLLCDEWPRKAWVFRGPAGAVSVTLIPPPPGLETERPVVVCTVHLPRTRAVELLGVTGMSFRSARCVAMGGDRDCAFKSVELQISLHPKMASDAAIFNELARIYTTEL